MTINPTILSHRTIALEAMGFALLVFVMFSGYASVKSILVLENTLLVLPTGGLFIALAVSAYKISDFLFKGHLVQSLVNKIKK
ncbi:exported protein of unknown function [Nitrosotalea devaniterrae]|uniref:Uncharacterized protein n=1 Tax=Nitrosotalea devaniterrae TaxID=1078905 RepID=A0A128A502_9ARCH|nr:exported protein of unknown function [Candidatus Nitrosotalea devanaterra]